MGTEVNPDIIRPTSTGAVTPDISPVVQAIVTDNASTDAVHPEESVTLTNAAADNSSTHTVQPEGSVTFSNSAFANPQPEQVLPRVVDEPAVQTKVVQPKKKPAPKASKTAETK